VIRLNCPYCHATLAPAELEPADIQGRLGLLCPDCGSVLVREAPMPESHGIEAHYPEMPFHHAR
jgi:hypothetical protein